jgi:hypothetical protein
MSATPDSTFPEPPAELQVRRTTRAPVHDPDLVAAHPVTLAPDRERPHRLVVLGDSLSQGFKSLAIHDTNLSWPALVAGAMGLTGDQFRYPSYPGPDDCPGLPLNVEALLKLLEAHAGDAPLLGVRAPIVAASTVHVLEDIRHYWESGDGSKPVPQGRYCHNLAIYGWDVRDALSKTAGWCRAQIPRPALLDHLRPHLPELTLKHNGEIAALRVLAGPLGDGTSQVSAARELGRDGVETLIVALGANNALASVLRMKVAWTPDDYLDWTTEQKLERKDASTVWRPSHFAAEYAELVEELKAVDARHVILATVPHVTIVPLLHGFGEKPNGSRYFARYGRVWCTEEDFDANRDECLTGDVCRQIDSAIDAYNDTIVAHVVQARKAGLDWHVFDLCALLDSLAYRRYIDDTSAQPDGYKPYVLPEALQRLSPQPDTRFFGSDRHGRLQGGLIALDGVHPTTIGYGILAFEILKILIAAGVPVARSEIDFGSLIGSDTLISDPPRTLTSDLEVLGYLFSRLGLATSLIEL